MPRNSPTAPGNVTRRWARSWLATATRVSTRSFGPAHGSAESPWPGSRAPGSANGDHRLAGSRPRRHQSGRTCCPPSRSGIEVPSPSGSTPRPPRTPRRAAHRPPDHRDVRSRPAHLRLAQSKVQIRRAISSVRHAELADDPPLRVDHGDGVAVGGPVHTTKALGGIMHVSLLAVAPVGKHPVVAGRVCRSLTDRRSGALSPIASRHVLGHRISRDSPWQSNCQRRRR